MSTQITLTTNGTVQDPSGNPITGSLVLVLSNDAVTTDTSPENNIAAGVPIIFTLTAGKIQTSAKIWSNVELTPSGTSYSAQVYSAANGGGSPLWKVPQNWVFSQAGGSGVDLSTLVPTNSSVAYAGAVLTAPSADQNIATNNLLPASGNTTQSLGTAAAPWNAVLGSVNVETLNSTLFADQFPGATADAKINAAIAALPGGLGIVDCRALKGSQAFLAQVVIGMGQTLLLPTSGTWTFNINNSAQSGIMVNNGGRLIGSGVGIVGEFNIEPAGTAVMDSLVSTNLSNVGTATGMYCKISGFALNYASSGAVISKGLLHIVNLYDGSEIHDIVVQSQQVGTSGSPAYGILVNGMCCGSSFHSVASNSYNSVYNIPFALIDQANFGSGAVAFHDCSFDHPGAGEPSIFIDQHLVSLFRGNINFFNLYSESNGGADTTTALFQSQGGRCFIYGGVFEHLLSSPTAYAFYNASVAGSALEVRGFKYGAVNTNSGLNAINNAASGQTVITDANGSIPNYVTNLAYRNGTIINQVAAGGIPNAGVNGGLIVQGNTQSILGTNDIMIQMSPSGGSAYSILEDLGTVGLALSTYSTHSVVIAPNRVIGVTVSSGGNVAIVGKFGCNGATPATQDTGYGTPTGNAKVSSFAASTITLAQLAAEVAQLVIDLKAAGLIGA